MGDAQWLGIELDEGGWVDWVGYWKWEKEEELGDGSAVFACESESLSFITCFASYGLTPLRMTSPLVPVDDVFRIQARVSTRPYSTPKGPPAACPARLGGRPSKL